LLKKLVFLRLTVRGVHIVTFNTGTLVDIGATFGIRWEVFNTSEKQTWLQIRSSVFIL